MAFQVVQYDTLGARLSGCDLADDPRRFTACTEIGKHCFDLILCNADDHADAAVEDAVHFVLVDVALLLQPVEHSRALPAGDIDDGLAAFGQYARDIVQQAAASDVSHGLDRGGVLDQLEQLLDVNACRGHQQVGQRLAVQLDVLDIGTGDFDDLADQRIAVGVRAGRGQRDQGVASRDFAAIDDFALFHHAYAEAGQVVVLAFIHARHLGGLTTDQRATSQLATGTDAGDYGGGNINVELAGGVVIEKEQRLGAAHHQIVHAHGDQVLADAVVLVQVQRQTQLGTDTVGAGDQYRLLVAGRNFAERAEAAEAAQDFRACGALGNTFDAFDQRFARIDIDASV